MRTISLAVISIILNCRISLGHLDRIDYGGPSTSKIRKDLVRLYPISHRLLRKDLGLLSNCMSKIPLRTMIFF